MHELYSDSNVLVVMFGDFSKIASISKKEGDSVNGGWKKYAFGETINFC